MRIVGLEKNSCVDYPEKLSAVIFTPGCNMDCYYCHNRSILDQRACSEIMQGEVIEFLHKRMKMLDAVVITGGEPTLQYGLRDFICEIKSMGYAVKLDTNGTRPDVLKDLLSHGYLDHIAMDIKAPLDRYEEICGPGVDIHSIQESVALILDLKDTSYEFRTTFIPELLKEDIIQIAKIIAGAKVYSLQQYRKPDKFPGFSDRRLLKDAHKSDYLRQTADELRGIFQRVEIRGI